MNYKLEFVQINEDVITTSGCDDPNAVAYVHFYWDNKESEFCYEVLALTSWLNELNDQSYPTFYYNLQQSLIQQYQNVTSEVYYHINTDGTLGKKCENPDNHKDLESFGM